MSKTVVIPTHTTRSHHFHVILTLIENPNDPKYDPSRILSREVINGHPDFWVYYADGKEHRKKGHTYPVIIMPSMLMQFPEMYPDFKSMGYRKYLYETDE